MAEDSPLALQVIFLLFLRQNKSFDKGWSGVKERRAFHHQTSRFRFEARRRDEHCW